MNTYFEHLKNIFTGIPLVKTIDILLIFAIGLGLLYLVAYLVRISISRRVNKQLSLIINKIVIYVGYTVLFMIVLKEVGIKLSAILGAAGIVGIVIGIASQASIGNIISGLFLISEKTFEIGDIIRIGTTTGVVQSIDLLSIKIKTFDNLLIRFPNQQVVSSELVNVTRYPIRRLDFNLQVAYGSDLKQVEKVLRETTAKNPLCLINPEPLLVFQNFGDSGIDILLGIWFEKANYLKVKNGMMVAIDQAFKENNIEIPFPHRSLIIKDNSVADLPKTK